MARFIGTVEEFNKFIGGYTRNKIQYETRRHKSKIGKCEHCGSRTKKIESAHLRGKERPVIIGNILQNYIDNNIIDIELNTFEEQYLMCHTPIEEVIKVLCKKCHHKYDNQEISNNTISEDKQIEDFMKNITLNKRDAIDLFNTKGYSLNNNNTIFSNINKSKDVYWLEPHNDKFKDFFYIILNDSINNKLHLFHIESNQITNPEKEFEQRNDKDYSKLIIKYSDNSFIDKERYDFKTHLKETIIY